MIIKRNFLPLICSLLILSGCETTPDASQLPAKPSDLLYPCSDGTSFLDRMENALNGALGLKEEWLIDFAAEAEKCRIQHDGLTKFVHKTWETR